MTGYQITQQWLGGPQYITVHTPAGCDPAVPPCTVTEQEVIGYTSGGEPISKGQSDSPWMAWVPTLTTLDQDGNAYQPYTAGIPYTLEGGSVVDWNSTDSQALAYLDSAPGAGARKAYQKRICNPLWSNVFGCKTGNTIWVHNDAVAEHEPSFFAKLKSLFGAEEYRSDMAFSASWKGIIAVVVCVSVIGVVGKKVLKGE
jgi:hypothetical protein